LAKAAQKIEDKPKRRGPQPPPPIPAGVDPLAGPLKLNEAGGVMRKAPQTVRKLADAGELEWVGGDIWGPSIQRYWDRHRVAGPRPELQGTPKPGKRGRGRPKKLEALADEEGASA
jgi:hypothetical protein